MFRLRSAVNVFAVLAALLLTGPGRSLAQTPGSIALVTRTAQAMGTEIRFVVYTSDEPKALRAFADGFAEFQRLETMMTTWRADSEVSRINAQAGIAPVKVSPETLEVIEMSDRASKMSGGAFDITFYALHGLWKFDDDMVKKVPDPVELKRRLQLVDYRKVIIDHAASTVMLKDKGMAINLGGIAKGYAVDRAAAILKSAGFKDALVQAGGDLMCLGNKFGKPWTTGIRDPRGPRDAVFAVMKLEDHAFSTAGDYERFFFLNGKRYHHILDPKTGWPTNNGLLSVTVVAPSSIDCDGFAKVIVLGLKRGAEVLKANHLEGIFVTADKKVYVTPGLAKDFTLRAPDYQLADLP